MDLSLALSEAAAGCGGCIEYSTDLFDAATIERLAGHYGRLLEAAPRDPDRPISRLPLLADAERRRMLVEWNATAPTTRATLASHALFEAQAARAPDAVAVT